MQIFLADGRDGTNEPTEGSTRGPRGPKKTNKKQGKITCTLALPAQYGRPPQRAEQGRMQTRSCFFLGWFSKHFWLIHYL